MSLADHLAAGTQETFRCTSTDMDSTAGLQDMQFFDRFEHDVGMTSLTPSLPSAFTPPIFRFVKSLYVPLSLAVMPTLGGAVWLFTLMKKQDINSFASSRVNVPSAIPFS